jgi:hypothetical protein
MKGITWQEAPTRTEWGDCMRVATVELSKDETLDLYATDTGMPLVEAVLRRLVLGEEPKTAPFPHDWQNRVVTEKAELDERLAKLQTFLGQPSAALREMSIPDLSLLTAQEHYMRCYSNVLRDRIVRFVRFTTRA